MIRNVKKEIWNLKEISKFEYLFKLTNVKHDKFNQLLSQ